jgi:hypothetical protein
MPQTSVLSNLQSPRRAGGRIPSAPGLSRYEIDRAPPENAPRDHRDTADLLMLAAIAPRPLGVRGEAPTTAGAAEPTGAQNTKPAG